ncbi:polysaccharide deacetylase family protein [Schleiferiaceae bacterium]|nr:polysaccharide deacetylase family protein [Schleiferiaceae bacterium]
MKILTIDLEEWFHIQFRGIPDEHFGKKFTQRLPKIIFPLLDLLELREIRATFLCVGWIAEFYPEIIFEIHRRGHEIGSHTFHHRLISEMKPEDFRTDLKKSCDSLSQITGEKTTVFRAPAFSLTEDTKWAIDILIEEGIETDLSIFPAKRDYGGYPEINTKMNMHEPFLIESSKGTLTEFPMTTMNFLGKRFPVSGGGYFRLYPVSLIRKSIGQKEYAMVYLHPRDFDPFQPIVHGLSKARHFKSYYGLQHTFEKLRILTKEFDFISIKQANQIIQNRSLKCLTL